MQPSTASAKGNFAACVATMVVSFVFVALRFTFRISARQMPSGADWLCLLALVLFFAYNIIIINFIFNISAYGAFDFANVADLDELRNLLKIGFQIEILFGSSLSIVKLSILWFYYALFHVNPTMRRVTLGTVVICLIWFIASVLLIVLQCTPPSAFWDTYLSPQYCLSNTRVLLGFEITNLLIDVLILVIPVRAIRALRLPRTKKASVMGIFLLGGFVCVTSIVRLTAIWHPPDVEANYDFPMTLMWSTIQVGTAIICACLPTLGPLLAFLAKPVRYLYNSHRSRGSHQHGSSGKNSKDPSNGSQRLPWVRIGDDGYHASAESNWIPGHSANGSDHSLQPLPKNKVLVERGVHIV